MNVGSVAFLDALGFKGIWQRCSPTDVISRLELVQEAFGRNVPPAFTMPGMSVSMRAFFLSDTIVVGAWANTFGDDALAQVADVLCLLNVIGAANLVQYSWLMKEPCLTFRGCVATGQFLMSENGQFVIGPAVDEAANGERLADGPFVWLTDEAEQLLASARQTQWHQVAFEGLEGQIPLLDLEVPFKDGTQRARKVVAPIMNIPFPPAPVVRQMFLETFNSTRDDVMRKKRNAVPLIDAALAFVRDNPFRLV